MPYIKQYDRLEGLNPSSAGQLNYALTQIIDKYLVVHGLNYTNINDCLGALEGAKLEFYRRVAVPYEDKKLEENGDVYSEENLTND